MTEFLDKLYASLERVLNFPLFNLSDGPFRVSQLLTLLLFIAVVVAAERAFQRLILKRVLIRSRLQTSLQYAISRIIGYTIITFGCLVALQSVGLNLSSLTIFAGAIGVGVGFGLQNIVNNFISGLIILAERPIAVGDFIEMAGTGGRVREINLRSTTVVTNDNISIIVPNSDFISSTVTNYSHGDARVRVRLPVGIAYGSDVQRFKQGMIDVALANPEVLRDPEPDVFFKGFGESSLDFEVAVWTADQSFRPFRFRSDLFFAIEAKLRELGIEIPFPQRDLHIRSSTHPLPLEITGQTAPPAR